MFPTSSQCVCNFDPKALFLSFGCLLLQHTRSLVIITFVLLRFGYVYEVALGVGHLGLDDRVVLYFFRCGGEADVPEGMFHLAA